VVISFLIGCALLFFGGTIFFKCGAGLIYGLRSYFFTTTTAHVTSAAITWDVRNRKGLCVSYQFVDNLGMTHTGDQYNAFATCQGSPSVYELNALMSNTYKVGKPLQVHYNYYNPSNVVMEKGITLASLGIFGLSFLLMAGAYACFKYCKDSLKFSIFN
jgi:hypothetical protein